MKCKCGEVLELDENRCCRHCGVSKVELDKEKCYILCMIRADFKRALEELIK